MEDQLFCLFLATLKCSQSQCTHTVIFYQLSQISRLENTFDVVTYYLCQKGEQAMLVTMCPF